MKRIVILLAATIACLAVSCNTENFKENENPAPAGMRIVTISASVDDMTKTSYDGGTAFSWTAGDQISVAGDDDNLYTFTADYSGAKTTFTGELPDGVEVGNYAFFPADANHTKSGSSLKYSIPEYKDLTSHPSADLPMMGDKIDGDDAFTFMHCSGAALVTLTNIPSKYKSVEFSFVSASLKLSGQFGVFKSSEEWKWNAAGGSNDSEKTFRRKVNVVNNEAQVYLPYAAGADMWANNTVNITGYDNLNNATALVADKKMKGSGDVYSRAVVRPMAPIILAIPDFSSAVSATCGSEYTEISELKAAADNYYLHLQFHGTTANWTGGEMHLVMCDGNPDGSKPHWAWATKGTPETNIEATGSIYTDHISSSFKVNGVTPTTKCYTSGDQTYWEISIPRTATTLLENSEVHVGVFVLETTSWGFAAMVPEQGANLIEVPLP